MTQQAETSRQTLIEQVATTHGTKGRDTTARGGLVEAFTAHPASVDETYLEHAAFAFSFSRQLFGAAFAALVHAVLPFAFEKTAGLTVRRLHDKMENRGK